MAHVSLGNLYFLCASSLTIFALSYLITNCRFLATLYIIDIVLHVIPVRLLIPSRKLHNCFSYLPQGAANFANYDGLLTTFYDPYVPCTTSHFSPKRNLIMVNRITSILVCRFMLSLRQFDTANARATFSMPSFLAREPATLEFGVQACENLPPFIASFARPVHVEVPPEADSDDILAGGSESESQELDAAALTWTLSSYEKSESASRGASEQTV